MPGITPQKRDLLLGIKNGDLSMKDVDTAVERILSLILQTPRMNEYPYSDNPDLKSHSLIAKDAATEGMVLLKNENNALPFANVKKTAIFGSGSYNFLSGGEGGSGCVHVAYTVSLLEGLERVGFSRDEELCKLYFPFIEKEHKRLAELRKQYANPPAMTIGEMPLKKSLINKKAKSDDIAVITISRITGEFFDSKPVKGEFLLSDEEQNLITNVSEAFHAQGKKVVVVLNIGNVIETASWKDKVDAILVSWLGGQEGGSSVVNILTGQVSPSGKLTMTFPVNYTDIPFANEYPSVIGGEPTEVCYKEGVYVGYRYFDTFGVQTSFPFGYGLSYTSFSYSDVELSSDKFNHELFASVNITNTGKVAGKEVVQLYLSAPSEKLDKPAKELKGFVKTRLLKPGESQRVYFRLTDRDLASFRSDMSAWVNEAGTYTINFASSSDDVRKKATFVLNDDVVVEKVNNVLKCNADFTDMKNNH